MIVPIPEAESLVGHFRMQFDPSAALGVPAHVTVIYPFKPPADLTDAVIERLRHLAASIPAFDVSFVGTDQFAAVLYLAPEPDEDFRRLISTIADHFPEAPPYEGKFSDIIPHLTVAQINDAPRLKQIAADFEREASGRLPLQSRVKKIVLIDNESGRWRTRDQFDLANG